jgi:hypothetical protein
LEKEMKEVLRQIVKMADIGLVKEAQLEEVMEGVKVQFRGGKTEAVVDGIYIRIDGRKHRFDVSEIRGIVIERGETNPEVTRKLAAMDKLELFIEQHMRDRLKFNEEIVDGILRMMQAYIQWQAGNTVEAVALGNIETGDMEHEGENDRENPAEKTISSKSEQVQTPNDTETGQDAGSVDGEAGNGTLEH